MFRRLCGDEAIRNVVVVTNMWGEVNPWVGEKRETELKEDDMFFKPILDNGGKIVRHDNTFSSAEWIIRLFLDHHPLPLRIQEELVDQCKDISQTGAGEELNEAIYGQMRKHQGEIEELREEMERAMWNRDEQTRRELEFEAQRLTNEVERAQNDRYRLESDYEREKEGLDARLQQIELEARNESERLAAQFQEQVDPLLNLLNALPESEAAQIRAPIEELSRSIGQRRRGFFSGLGGSNGDNH